ncbi:hypothetical protein BDW02DRAFT_605136 [Decorospora gaudefroyi]|uniref:Uncharacterized protein n=1 Tax=Decorospora gaudefroyi TaxID=184978 RepID=A0A6A5K2T3_9PLEO|nr:hypothetical protein BDW02DRAFT_605136 [Decorospora gaudefroyi]
MLSKLSAIRGSKLGSGSPSSTALDAAVAISEASTGATIASSGIESRNCVSKSTPWLAASIARRGDVGGVSRCVSSSITIS